MHHTESAPQECAFGRSKAAQEAYCYTSAIHLRIRPLYVDGFLFPGPRGLFLENLLGEIYVIENINSDTRSVMSVEPRSSSTVPFTSRVPGSLPSHLAFGRREHRVTLPQGCNPFIGELPSYPLKQVMALDAASDLSSKRPTLRCTACLSSVVVIVPLSKIMLTFIY